MPPERRRQREKPAAAILDSEGEVVFHAPCPVPVPFSCWLTGKAAKKRLVALNMVRGHCSSTEQPRLRLAFGGNSQAAYEHRTLRPATVCTIFPKTDLIG